MPKFEFVLTDDTGRKEEGFLRAPTKDAALKILEEKEKIILALNEVTPKSFMRFFTPRPYLSLQDKMLFVKNLSTMVKVGITVTESMKIMLDQAESARAKRLYEEIIDMINSGQTLGKSMEEFDYIFSKLFINMISTGEKSGNLQNVLEYLDEQMEKEYSIRKKVISSLIYPAVIIGMTLIMAVGIVVFIMPKIVKVFENFDITLPLPTRILIGTSNFITQSPFLTLAIVGGVVGFFMAIFKVRAIKPILHSVTLRVPIFGSILVAANMARFTRTLSSLLQSSVPVTEGLKVIADMLDNTLYKKALLESAEKVEKGSQLGESLEDYPKLFPSLAVKMIAIGERTGSLETTSGKVAEFYEAAVDGKTRNLSVLLEPILLVMMSAMVGGIALSIILPIYQLPNLLSK